MHDTSLESAFHWLSKDTVKFEVVFGVARNLQKSNSHFMKKSHTAACCNEMTLYEVTAMIAVLPGVRLFGAVWATVCSLWRNLA